MGLVGLPGVVGLVEVVGLARVVGLAGALGKVIQVRCVVITQQGSLDYKVNVVMQESDSLKILMV